jgi:signal transduction histidine kinase
LSNIRRHTKATQATIKMGCDEERFNLSIGNEGTCDSLNGHFVPRSITARANSLGGHVQIERAHNSGTVINIKIPL